MDANGYHKLEQVVATLQSLRCWYATGGGAAGPTFELALGEKVARRVGVKNPAHSDEFRHFEGEANLLVWCCWRLDGPNAPVTSCDDSPATRLQGLQSLVGTRVASAALARPAWDLTLGFTNGLVLRVFCDHVPGEPSFDGNWEVWARDTVALVGPGAQFTVQPCSEAERTQVMGGQPTDSVR
jgi:hypothetical protein